MQKYNTYILLYTQYIYTCLINICITQTISVMREIDISVDTVKLTRRYTPTPKKKHENQTMQWVIM